MDDEKLNRLANRIPGILFQFEVSKDGRLSVPYVCRRIHELLGYHPEALQNNPLLLSQAIPADDIEQIRLKAMAASATMSILELEQRLHGADGRSKWLRIEASPHLLDNGDIRYDGIALDITERKEQEIQLKNAKNMLEKTLFSLREAVFVVGPPERAIIEVCNPAVERIFGYPKEELMGEDTSILHVDREMFAQFAEISEPALESKGFFQTEYQMRRKNGEVFFTENTVTVLYDEDGWRSGVVSVVRDITEQKRTAEALRRSNEELRSQSKSLEDLNAALRVLLRQREEDQREIEESISSNVEKAILPYIQRLKGQKLSSGALRYIEIIEKRLYDLTSPLIPRLDSEYQKLTPKEIQVADLVKEGKTSQEIAEILNVSKKTVDFHRNRLRNKLQIKDRTVNLRSYLLTLSKKS